jgi:hypothetical protein
MVGETKNTEHLGEDELLHKTDPKRTLRYAINLRISGTEDIPMSWLDTDWRHGALNVVLRNRLKLLKGIVYVIV